MRLAGSGLVLAALVLGLAVRLPGVGWGIGERRPSHGFHSDEDRILKTAAEVRTGQEIQDDYPSGFAVQVGMACRLFRVGGGYWADYVLPGRLLSLCYGLLIVVGVAFAAAELAFPPGAACVAVFAAALSGLLGVHSHYATADIGSAFWLLATMLLSLKAYRRRHVGFFVASLVCAGMALAFKMSWVALLPPLIVAGRLGRLKWLGWALILPVCLAVFETANLWSYSWDDFSDLWAYASVDNIGSPAKHDRHLNLAVYTGEIVASLGLPVFVLVLVWLRQKLRRRSRSGGGEWDRAVLWTVVVPTLALFLTACILAVPFARHILPVLAPLCLAAGAGWGVASRRLGALRCPRTAIRVLMLLLLYQVAYVVSVERPYVRDTRVQMAEWMAENFDSANRVYVSRVAKKYRWDGLLTRDLGRMEDAEYVLLHEYYYRRYLRSVVNPFNSTPSMRRVYHPRDGHIGFIPPLFAGDLPYEEVKRFAVRYFTPELMLYKWLWGSFPDFAGDSVLFRRKTQGELRPQMK